MKAIVPFRLNVGKAAFLLLLPLMMGSCRNDDRRSSSANGDGVHFESREVGWYMTIPKGWKIVSDAQSSETDAKGKKALEDTYGEEVDMQGLKHLVAFQKDQYNNFTATIDPYTEDVPGEYDASARAVGDLIYETYQSQGIRADTAGGQDVIDGRKFHTFHSTIYAPDGKVLMHQVMYAALVNGYDFVANINYNNDETKDVLIRALKNSTFK